MMKTYIKKLINIVRGMGLYGILFGLVIFTFGIVNCYKVLDFWVFDRTSYNEWTVEAGNKVETDYISNFWGKMQFVNFNGLIRDLLGQHEMNAVVKLNNGYLVTTHGYVSDDVLKTKAEALGQLNSYLKEQSIPMLFAVTPYTSSKYDPELPVGIEDYGNDNMDRFMKMLEGTDIETIDFREQMHDDGINQYDMMFKTDHHWTTEAGFYAYQNISAWVEKATGCSTDEKVSDINNYDITVYPKWHLGSRGQRTGIYFAGADDFDLITPKFETSIVSGDKSGTFEDMVINTKPFKNRIYTSSYTYDWVLGNSLGNFENPNAENDIKVLVIGDSMAKAVNPYLILTYREIRYIYDGSNPTMNKKIIENYKPDVVILLYYADFICKDGESRGFDFVLN